MIKAHTINALKRWFFISFCFTGLIASAVTLVGLQSFHRIVVATPELNIHQPRSITVLAKDGQLLRGFTTKSGHWRIPVSLDEVDPQFIHFLLAYEDQRFYNHNGVDKQAVLRAVAQMIWHREVISGASTVTMQVARLLSKKNTRTLTGKIQQMVQAMRLEQRLDKQEILGLYLNHAPYGGNLEGIRAASWAYFGKEPKWLNLSEIALLIALPQAPEIRRPDHFPEVAFKARTHVLEQLKVRGFIDEADRIRAMNAPIPHARKPFPMHAAHLAQMLYNRNNQDSFDPIHTTIDATLQISLEEHLVQRVAAMGRGFSIAVLVLDHQTGEVRVAVQVPKVLSGHPQAYVNMMQAIRSPGSTLKPMIYALAFEQGIAHPNTLINDHSQEFDGFAPDNFNTDFHGTITIAEALRLSLNIPAVAVLQKLDPHRLVSRLRRAGVTLHFPENAKPNLAIGLGGVGITLEDLVRLYSALAHDGKVSEPYVEIDRKPQFSSGTKIISPSAARLLIHALRRPGDMHHSKRRNLVYKTGTSYGYRDAWTIGFDGQHTVGVWVGRPDGASAGRITGATTAQPIFFDVYARLGTVPHPAMKANILLANHELPQHLRYFLKEGESDLSTHPLGYPGIAFPHSNTIFQLSQSSNLISSLALKVRGGTPPFTWLADGRPIITRNFRRESVYQVKGPGFITFTVVDALGNSDHSRIRLIE